jgi:hypothetical protein
MKYTGRYEAEIRSAVQAQGGRMQVTLHKSVNLTKPIADAEFVLRDDGHLEVRGLGQPIENCIASSLSPLRAKAGCQSNTYDLAVVQASGKTLRQHLGLTDETPEMRYRFESRGRQTVGRKIIPFVRTSHGAEFFSATVLRRHGWRRSRYNLPGGGTAAFRPLVRPPHRPVGGFHGAASPRQRGDVHHEAVFDVALQHPVVGLVDLLGRDHLDF